MNCPKCHSEIEAAQRNIQTDIAQCLNCDYIFKISEHLDTETDVYFDVNDAPKGTWYKNEFNETIIGASTRSPIAFFLVPFMLVWSGGSIGGIYGMQIVDGEFNLLLSLFGIPFILGSIFFWSIALMAIWGKVELTLDNTGGKIFTGIGNIGRTKNFLWSDTASISEKQSNNINSKSIGGILVFEGKKRISFGLGLRQERRYYMLNAIKSVIQKNRWK